MFGLFSKLENIQSGKCKNDFFNLFKQPVNNIDFEFETCSVKWRPILFPKFGLK